MNHQLHCQRGSNQSTIVAYFPWTILASFSVFKPLGHSRPRFLYFLLSAFNSKLFHIWIRTADLWRRKQRVCQLSHNRCPSLLSLLLSASRYTVNIYSIKVAYFWIWTRALGVENNHSVIRATFHFLYYYLDTAAELFKLGNDAKLQSNSLITRSNWLMK